MSNQDLVNYVDAANDLAGRLHDDIKAGDTISKETVLALNQFVLAAQVVADLREMIDDEKKRMN